MDDPVLKRGADGATDGPCSCVADPFGAVPAELRPQPKKRGSLRKAGCPSCGKQYWTNRQGELCLECEKSSEK